MLQTHGTSASFINVIRECPDLPARMDMGIRTPQCFYLFKRRGGGTRKRKTIYCFRQMPFYNYNPPWKYLSRSAQFQRRRVVWADIRTIKS